MTAQQLKDYITGQLAVPVNQVIKVINSLFAIIDFTTGEVASIIPPWTSALTFNTDGSGDGRYCKHPDTNGKSRIFETRTDANINHAPPTNPLTTENTYWKEVSASSSAAIPEWAAGPFGPGLVIVFHNHSVDGRGLYVLLDPVRPFASSNIETEITALKWERIGGSGSGKGVAKTYATIAAMLADQAVQKEDFFYLVTDASADATVDAGWALYQKLSATTANISNYRKLNEAESLDVIFSSTPDWDDTTAGKVERSTQAESEAIVTQAQAGATTGLSGGRTPSEIGLYYLLRKFIALTWTWAQQQTFTLGLIVSDATASLPAAFNGSKKLISRSIPDFLDDIGINPVSVSASVSSGTATLNANSKYSRKWVITAAQSSAFAVTQTNKTSLEYGHLVVAITGTVAITFDSDFVMALNGYDEPGWNNTTKVLTVIGGTASPVELSWSRFGSVFLLKRSPAYYTS